jgi:hypothetical protein
MMADDVSRPVQPKLASLNELYQAGFLHKPGRAGERWWTAIGSTISIWRVSPKGPRTAWEMNALRMYSYVLQLIELRLSSIVLFDSDTGV